MGTVFKPRWLDSILLICQVFVYVGAVVYDEEPRNVAAVVNSTASFTCGIKDNGKVEFFRIDNTLISDNLEIGPQISDPDKYTVTQSSTSKIFTLNIHNVGRADGGVYRCNSDAGGQVRFGLVVLDAVPICTADYTENTVLEPNQQVTLECYVRYSLPAWMSTLSCWSPHMKWETLGDTIAYNPVRNPGYYRTTLTRTPTTSGQAYKCELYFTEPCEVQGDQLGNWNLEPPIYVFRWTSPKVKIPGLETSAPEPLQTTSAGEKGTDTPIKEGLQPPTLPGDKGDDTSAISATSTVSPDPAFRTGEPTISILPIALGGAIALIVIVCLILFICVIKMRKKNKNMKSDLQETKKELQTTKLDAETLRTDANRAREDLIAVKVSRNGGYITMAPGPGRPIDTGPSTCEAPKASSAGPEDQRYTPSPEDTFGIDPSQGAYQTISDVIDEKPTPAYERLGPAGKG